MIDLAAIRRTVGLTQTELAAKLGVGQAQISKIERQGDMLISTLASYLTALGVDAKLVGEVGGNTLTYTLTGGRHARWPPRPRSRSGPTTAPSGSSGAS